MNYLVKYMEFEDKLQEVQKAGDYILEEQLLDIMDELWERFTESDKRFIRSERKYHREEQERSRNMAGIVNGGGGGASGGSCIIYGTAGLSGTSGTSGTCGIYGTSGTCGVYRENKSVSPAIELELPAPTHIQNVPFKAERKPISFVTPPAKKIDHEYHKPKDDYLK